MRSRDGIATLALLDENDFPWIAALIDEMEAAIGRPWRELLERIACLPSRSGPARQAAVIQALRSSISGRQAGELRASAIRRELFGKVAQDQSARTDRLAAAAAVFATTVEQIEIAMWADLPAERIVVMPAARPTAMSVAAAANLSMIRRALMRCHSVRLRLTGNARAIARCVALRGLLMTAHSKGNVIELAVSGPLALFHRTTVYGRAMGSFVAQLAWCERFVLEADCELQDQPTLLRIVQPVLLPNSEAPTRYDSALEARFARDFVKHAPKWRLLREPTPVDVEGRLAFPDFLVEHRDDKAVAHHFVH
jgi:predicted nuclease of restriction endonuclease-like RecB superfamily